MILKELKVLLDSMDLPGGHYCVLSGSALAFYGFRETTDDLDLAVSEELFKELQKRYQVDLSNYRSWIDLEGQSRQVYQVWVTPKIAVDITPFPHDTIKYKMIDGYPIDTLDRILDGKVRRNLPKDQQDILKIRAMMAGANS